MVYCKACGKDVKGIRDGDGLLSCERCGKVLKFDVYSTEATFVKNASGASQLSGKLVRSVQSENVSRQRLYEKAEYDLTNLKNGLEMGEEDVLVNEAMKYYRIAVERNFTKGRRTEQVQAACLYIACRENRKPYLLIDFSNYLQINIYMLGAVFLQLCKVLNLTEHPICQKLLDPSIFIHRYTASLAGGKNKDVSNAALTIIASMNRDWLQIGRRPSGLWGAALYISALSHGIDCSKSDILRLVHVCEATLSKRLVEFETTESGSLTIDELNAKAEEIKEITEQPKFGLGSSGSKELLCKHKNDENFAFRLCRDCYAFFIGFEGGSDPPAFQRAEKQRREKELAIAKAADSNLLEKEVSNEDVFRYEKTKHVEPGNGEAAAGHVANDAGCYNKMHGMDDMHPEVHDESDNFADIDDAEVDGYLHSEEEKRFKKIIWEEMNREYLEEQAAKEAAAAAAKEAWEANFKDCPQAAKDLNAAVAAAVAKTKKERQQKRAAEARNATPPQTAAEAAGQMLTRKRVSSKINYDVLEKLFDDPGSVDTKKLRTNSDDEKLHHTGDEDPKAGDVNNTDGLENKNADAVEDEYNDEPYDEKLDGTYDYDDIDFDYEGE